MSLLELQQIALLYDGNFVWDDQYSVRARRYLTALGSYTRSTSSSQSPSLVDPDPSALSASRLLVDFWHQLAVLDSVTSLDTTDRGRCCEKSQAYLSASRT